MYKPFIFLLLLYSPAHADIATGKADKNALYRHASPYLAMHGRDPVRWREWNRETIDLARKQNKLLFLSSGYFSCHWCHVMQRESYQNNNIADLLNSHFIPVKIDRELDSALDAHLIDFVSRTQGISGWPLNVFVTPDGHPLVGMVYVPPDNFREILHKLANEWHNNRISLAQMAKAASEELSSIKASNKHQLPAGYANRLAREFISSTFKLSDDMQGGFGSENKFPSVPQLNTLLTIYEQQPDENIYAFLSMTLDQMARQGLRDQLGGGFYRYVVDPGWQIPHFEKMLYDNALLASLYFRAAVILKKSEYETVALETISFMLDELGTTSNAFAASLSAVDDKGVEGGYYLWNRQELVKILNTEELQIAGKFWHLEGAPDLDHGYHLVQSASVSQLARTSGKNPHEIQNMLASAKAKMLQARKQRSLPRDNKILAAWNGLALSALVAANRHDKNKKLYEKTRSLAEFIQQSLWDGAQLKRAYAAGKGFGKATLEDHAYVVQGLYDWWQLSNSDHAAKLLTILINQAWQRFYDNNGWQLSEDMLLKYGKRQGVIADGPMPSPSAILSDISYRFARATGDRALEKRALQSLNNTPQEVANDAFWFASHINTIIAIQGLTGNYSE